MSTGPQPSASYSVTIRVQLPHTAGSFARVAGAIGDTGAILGAIDLVRVDDGRVVRGFIGVEITMLIPNSRPTLR